MTEDPITWLECPRCLRTIAWKRTIQAAPGYCVCRSKRPWNVATGPRARNPGFVRVYSYEGSQYLTGPDFQENPNAWVK